MLKTLRLKAAFQRLDFAEFWSKRGNRPTSEAQPQKKRGNLKPTRVLLEGGSKKERTHGKRTHRAPILTK